MNVQYSVTYQQGIPLMSNVANPLLRGFIPIPNKLSTNIKTEKNNRQTDGEGDALPRRCSRRKCDQVSSN